MLNPVLRLTAIRDRKPPAFRHGSFRLLLPWLLWSQPLVPALLSASPTIGCVSPDSPGTPLLGPPEVKVTVAGAAPGTATLRFYRRITPPVNRPDFSIVVLPDTQFYTGRRYGGVPEIFENQTEWIVANRERHNIVFTVQLGDIVELGDTTQDEWIAASSAMARLEDPLTTKLAHGIPYSVAVGNHDGSGLFVSYNRYFGYSRFAGRAYYGGKRNWSNQNHYSLFSAGGMDFLVLSLEYEAGNKSTVMEWAHSVLAANADRRAIVVSHSLLTPLAHWSQAGQPIYDAVKDHPNVFLMLCGHEPQTARRSDTVNGTTITTLLSDYSNEPNGGNGWLRILRFSPETNQIEVTTYSPWLNQFKPAPFHQFRFGHNMSLANRPFELVATVTATPFGIVSGGVWQDLSPGASYDWQVTLEQNGVVTASPVWSFTTSPAYQLLNNSAIPPVMSATPLQILRINKLADGNPVVVWRSIGGHRYRVQYGTPAGFREIVRSAAEETDPAPAGTPSFQAFVDDGSLTGGSSPSRFYRIAEVE